MSVAVELRNVWHMYPGSRQWALRGVSIKVGKGEVLAIVGPNGSGKTTLLKVAGLIYRPARGSIKLLGHDYWRTNGARRLELRRHIVYVHEKPILMKGTVLHNISYGLTLRGVPREEAFRRAERLLLEMGGGDLRDKTREQLSAGEAQLVSILRAVATEPQIVLLDEPTAHLDLSRRRKLARLVGRLRDGGVSVVLATHDYMLAYRIADRAVVLEEGSVKAEGDPKIVLEL